MKIREIYEEAVDVGKCALKIAVCGAVFMGVVYGAEYAGLYTPGRRKTNSAAAAIIMIAGSQNKDSKGGVIEIREIKYDERGLENKVQIDERE